MKITTVSYKRSSTLNVGEFESVRIEVGAVAEIETGESATKAWDDLREAVCDEIIQDVRDVRAKAKRREERQG